MTDTMVNPRKTMAIVVVLALVAGISISEGLKAIPAMFVGNAVSGFVVVTTATIAFFSISLIAFVVYAMDRVSDRVAHPIPMFDRLLEAGRER